LIMVKLEVANEVSRRLREDLPFVPTRLIGIEPDLYSSIDRLDAEAEFRCAVSAPLAVLLAVAAGAYDARVLWLLVAPLALFPLGVVRHHRALTTIAQAIYTGRVKSPVLDLPGSDPRAEEPAPAGRAEAAGGT
jgi:hypothetical protein